MGIGRIGIVGGGQLGKMLTIAAKKMGYYVVVSDPTPQSPAGQVADLQIIADYKDDSAINKLADQSDVLTFEIELANSLVLKDLKKAGKVIHPSPSTLEIIQDKLKQKKYLKKHRVKTAEFIEVTNKSDVVKAAKVFGYPLVLKARTDAYDGRGNVSIKRDKDIDMALKKLEGRGLYVEKYVPFVLELAVMVAKSTKGKIVLYPIVQTIHENHVCDTVITPAKISKEALRNAQALARRTVRHLSGAGVFGVEMFLTKDDNILVNEIAPRVHNSGHYTIEACVTSQFEQHIRAVMGLPLGSTKMISKAAVMKNILGRREGDGKPLGIEKALKIDGVSLHMYGKVGSKVGRKMGHITVVGDSVSECLRKANKARRVLNI